VAGFTIDRKKLYDEIWDISARKVAEKYGVSYTRLLAKCKECSIPTPPSGYFTKRQFGKPVTQTPLPESDIQSVVIENHSIGGAATEPPVVDISDLLNRRLAVDQKKEDSIENAGNDNAMHEVALERYVDPQQAVREELFKKVWEKPVSQVSKEYGISDAALRKRCVKLEIPMPDRGYWAKLKAGKPVNKPKSLPVVDKKSVCERPKVGVQRQLHIAKDALSFMEEDGRKEILSLAAKLEVGGPHVRMLAPIEALADKCREWQKKDISYNTNYYRDNAPFLVKTISTKSVSRTFHIIDVLVKALQPYKGKLDHDNRLVVNGEPIHFTIEEGKDKIPHEITTEERIQLLQYEEASKKGRYAYKPNIPKYDHPWNKRLCIKIYGKYTFKDCDSYMLEDRIGEILIAFFEASYIERIRRLDREEQQRKEAEERRRKDELRRIREQEQKRTNDLVSEAEDYAIACQIRAYIAGVEKNPDNPKNNPEWLEWAREKADWYDPTISREDAYLGKRCYKTDIFGRRLEDKGWW